MPSHMSDIGFLLSSEEEFAHLGNQALQHGERLPARNGYYVHWAVGKGVELWAQLDQQEIGIGLHPHFHGKARMQVGITSAVHRPDFTPLDGSFYCWADPQENEPDNGVYPLVIDLPDAGLHDNLQLPCIRHVQIAAFAHHLSAFENEEVYLRSDTKLAPQAFIPSGLFTPTPSMKNKEYPEAMAIFTGKVLETERIINPVSKTAFIWARVETLGGEVDVVADPFLLKSNIVPGGIIKGDFWLSGRLLD